ncbi:MAG: STAS domain-containing protein [Planctomycetota bacterium]|nr:STAS domain-containing protein [Planctomycetota bacterium]
MKDDAGCFFKVASAGETVYIKVHGYALAVCCPTFRAFVEKMTEEGRRTFIVDLGACKMMDSSFMGTLLGIMECEEGIQRKLIIINADERNYNLLQGVGLTRVLTILKTDVGVPKNLVLHKLRVKRVSKDKLREAVEEAHRRLVEVDESNRKRFEPLRKALLKEIAEEQ